MREPLHGPWRPRLHGVPALAAATLMLGCLGGAAAVAADDPRYHAIAFGLTLLGSGCGSLLAMALLLRLAERSPRFGVGARVILPLALAILVMLVNVWVTARIMLTTAHDSLVLAALLGYAGVLALLAAVPLSGPLRRGLTRLTDAVERTADGEHGVRVPVETADELGVLAAAFNAMADKVEQAARQQHELDAARRALLAAVSHDLRTPLAAIRAMLEAIQDGVVDDAQTVERYHRAMLGEVSRLSTLIDDLFELTRIEAGALQLSLRPTDVGELLVESAEAMHAEAERAGVRLAVDVTPGTPLLTGDPQQLQRVLLNLITNALRHTPADGSVMLRAEPRAGGIALSVTDTGEGIPQADLPHIFERFYRADKSRSRASGGSGLGLAIARGIVEAHGGQIAVASAIGQGTQFTVTLPCRP